MSMTHISRRQSTDAALWESGGLTDADGDCDRTAPLRIGEMNVAWIEST